MKLFYKNKHQKTIVPQALDDEQRWVGDKKTGPILKMKDAHQKQNLILSKDSTPTNDDGAKQLT